MCENLNFKATARISVLKFSKNKNKLFENDPKFPRVHQSTYIYFALSTLLRMYMSQNEDRSERYARKRRSKFSWIMSYFIVFRGRFTLSREFKSLSFVYKLKKEEKFCINFPSASFTLSHTQVKYNVEWANFSNVHDMMMMTGCDEVVKIYGNLWIFFFHEKSLCLFKFVFVSISFAIFLCGVEI